MLIDWFEEKSLHYFSKHKWKKFFSLLVHLFVWASFSKNKDRMYRLSEILTDDNLCDLRNVDETFVYYRYPFKLDIIPIPLIDIDDDCSCCFSSSFDSIHNIVN